MKLNAGALYLSIVIALIIAMICSSLIVVSFYFKLYYLQDQRSKRLTANIDAGVLVALQQSDVTDSLQEIDLYNDQTDSLSLNTKQWGFFKVVNLETHIQTDTLRKAFLIGSETKKDEAVLYICDEDRPLSISAGTRITGTAYVPKSGIKKAYVNGKPYTGDQLVYGKMTNSERVLPKTDSLWIDQLQRYFVAIEKKTTAPIPKKLQQSFNAEPVIFYMNKKISLNTTSLKGNIIIVSDSTVILPADSKLEDIQIYAPQIRVESGFKGSCQLFARDSIVVSRDVEFNYPSALGVFRDDGTRNPQPKVILGENVQFSGIIFSYEPKRTELQTLISIGKKSIIKGEVYATGLIKFDDHVKVNGKVSCINFLMQSSGATYTNYLVNTVLSRPDRNKYYLSSPIFAVKQSKQSVLKWVD